MNLYTAHQKTVTNAPRSQRNAATEIPVQTTCTCLVI